MAPYRPKYDPVKQAYYPVLCRSIRIADKLMGTNIKSPESPFHGINQDLAFIFLCGGHVEEATKMFQQCVESERLRAGDAWPSTEQALCLLVPLAISQQRAGDMRTAIDALQTSLKLAEDLFGHFDERTAEIASRLKTISKREETNLQHHKAVLLASTGNKSKRHGASQLGLPGERSARRLPGGGVQASSYDAEYTLEQLQLMVSCFRSEEWENLRSLLRNLDERVDMNAPITEGSRQTILMVALLEPTDEAATIILNEAVGSINVEAQDGDGQTAIFYASLGNHKRIITRLVHEFGADPNASNIQGQTAAWRAATVDCTRLPCVTVLLRCGVDEESIPSSINLSAFEAAIQGISDIEMKHLKSEGDVNRPNVFGNTLLHYAVCDVDEVLRYVLELRPDPNVRNRDGDMPLHIAVRAQRPGSVARLVALGPAIDINARTSNHGSALHLAIISIKDNRDRSVTVSLLLRCENIDVNSRDTNGRTPLMVACAKSDYNTMAILLTAPGVNTNLRNTNLRNTNLRDSGGLSLLLRAINRRNLGMVSFLMDNGYCNASEQVEGGNAVLFAARGAGEVAILEYLVRKAPEEARAAYKQAQKNGWYRVAWKIHEVDGFVSEPPKDSSSKGEAKTHRKWKRLFGTASPAEDSDTRELPEDEPPQYEPGGGELLRVGEGLIGE
ncbi:ankyrin repeat-containing domain protein [Lasiosphaeria ovina]|uniref:Ankyrin repeat-containing domain protein n=1 Tax=Lasiosphaeria ovina TaxID=92902 RepID=A0AAE0N5K5_9PEZI|nr:ankyrin repeat-containing domain protein [Lasiosphaeria ovina]